MIFFDSTNSIERENSEQNLIANSTNLLNGDGEKSWQLCPCGRHADSNTVVFVKDTPSEMADSAKKNPDVESSGDHIHTNFHEMNLNQKLLQGICAYGFEAPSYIQQRAIIPCIRGRDVIIQAKSGTGNPATFSIAILQKIDPDNSFCQSLILTSTRDVALQIQDEVIALGNYLNVTCHACIGGTNIKDDKRILKNGVQIVVGTPGRVFDMLNRRALLTDHIKIFVLDEADKMLSPRFGIVVNKVFQSLNTNPQVIMVSGTISSDLLEMTPKFMRDPIRIVDREEDEFCLHDVKEIHVNVENDELKFDALFKLYNAITNVGAVIFCNTSTKVDWLFQRMRSKNLTVSGMHGDMSQNDLENVLEGVRSGDIRVLITSDITMLVRDKGVLEIPLVINYDIPTNRETYLSRISGGRARFSRRKVVINFVINNSKSYNSLFCSVDSAVKYVYKKMIII